MSIKPETHFEDFYEKARFDLTWKLNFFLAVLLPFLALTLFIFNQGAYLPTLFGWAISIVNLIVMRQSKNYKIPAYFFSFAGVFLCIYTLFNFKNEVHFVDPLWMVICILYTYFTLGKLWGNINLFLASSSIAIFVLVALPEQIDLIDHLDQPKAIALAVNVCICMIVIAYLIYEFINTTHFAEASYHQMNVELRTKNQEVQLQNEEKSVMLREIHHRVKNNLQVISSLLRLQAREAKDDKTIELFKDSTNRVVAMALIHEKMYQTKDLAKINLEEYLRTLLNDLIDSYSIQIPIKADIHSNVEMISNQSLVPLALLFNELVSNTLKHAFSEKDEGTIKIDIDRENGKIVLSYWDNGIWREKQKETSFGLELIESLTEQLDGTCKRSTKLGTSYEFTLPDNL